MDKILPALTLAACAVLMARLLIGERRRARFDAAARRGWFVVRRRVLLTWHWRASKRAAAQAAEEAIRRARTRAQRDGNVYKPDTFRKPPNKLH